MMKLRHLFDNRDLAMMLLENWTYDESSLELLDLFRISANAIYPFKKNGELLLLRFAPSSEKKRGNIDAELDFIDYLHSRGYNALEIEPSKTGDRLIAESTPWGDYYASVFKRVRGTQIADMELGNDLLNTFGKSLGRLHALSHEYLNPKTKRWDFMDVLNWIEQALQNLSKVKPALLEVQLLKKVFSSLPKTPTNYGLIHYDFELDNVFYETDTNTCSVIDFDDSMYNWYVADIERTLESIKENTAEKDYMQKRAVFIAGYRSEFEISDEELKLCPVFRRFADLYGYTRCMRSVQEKWNNEPEWLLGLRSTLAALMNDRSQSFGKEIPDHQGFFPQK